MVSFLDSFPTRFPLLSPFLGVSAPSAPHKPRRTPGRPRAGLRERGAARWARSPGRAAGAPRRIHREIPELCFLNLDRPIGVSEENTSLPRGAERAPRPKPSSRLVPRSGPHAQPAGHPGATLRLWSRFPLSLWWEPRTSAEPSPPLSASVRPLRLWPRLSSGRRREACASPAWRGARLLGP